MKNLILALFLSTTLIALGQNEKRGMKKDHGFTTEQMAILKTKKMTLALDLNSNQQKEILSLNKKWIAENSTQKEAYKSLNREEMTSDQKFEMLNKKMDLKLAQQEEIKNILDKEQYQLWKEHTGKKQHKSKWAKAQKKEKSHKR